MDRIEKPQKAARHYANEGEIADRDRPLLPTATGREPGTDAEIDSVLNAEVREKQDGPRRRDVTDYHDPGTDEETGDDGLTEMQEAVRHATEDVPTGRDPNAHIDKVPVFDRGSLPPKL